MLFYHSGKFTHAGKIAFLYPLKDVNEQFEETWPCLIFIHDIRGMEIPLEKIQ
jgi:hypothetical protein